MAIVITRTTVCVDGKEVKLRNTARRILRLLADNPEHIFPRDQILELIWGVHTTADDVVVRTGIRDIRKAIPGCIETIYGAGYRVATTINIVGDRNPVEPRKWVGKKKLIRDYLERIYELRNQGWTNREIATELGFHERSVSIYRIPKER